MTNHLCVICKQMICPICRNKITEEEIKNNKVHKLLGDWSHKKCDEETLKKIDKNMKVIKQKNTFQL